MNQLSVIDIQITTRCNRKCKYCFGPQTENKNLPYNEIKKIMDEMYLFGIGNLSLSGGEPLLYPEIIKVLEYAKIKNIKVSLSTNTDYLLKNKGILSYVDVVGIPIDSVIEENHDTMRGKNSYKNIIKALDYIEGKGEVDVRIGTVITEINRHEISRLTEIISKYTCIKVWRIYDRIVYDENKMKSGLKTSLELSPRLIRELEMATKGKTISYITKNERNLGYFIIEPDGKVFIPRISKVKDRKIYIGSIYKDTFKELICRWTDRGSIKNHNSMSNNIFER